MTEFSTKYRETLSEKKQAMPDGSYPIRNRSDLKNAISSYGRAKDKEAVKRWIKKRARELNAEDLIPDSWNTELEHSEYLVHYGVLGMKWGVRRKKRAAAKIQKWTDIKKALKSDVETYVPRLESEASSYNLKSLKAKKKANKFADLENERKEYKYTKKSEKYAIKSAQLMQEANDIKVDYVVASEKVDKYKRKYNRLVEKYGKDKVA